MTQPTVNNIIADLERHATETGTPLPIAAGTIVMMEKLWDVSLDLETGSVATGIDADDGLHTLDNRTWLADLETAGEVKVQWTCRPENWDFERNRPKGQA